MVRHTGCLIMNEVELSEKIKQFFTQRRFTVITEAPLLTKRIDVLCYKKGIFRNKMVAIEVKISHWNKALTQAIIYKLGTDQVYIAIWHEFIHRVNIKELKKFGIGLIEINGTVIVRLKPKKIKKTQFDIKNNLIDLFEKKEVGNN